MVLTLGLMLAGPAQTVRAGPATHTVTINATAYAPQELAVNVGDTVVWVNKDPFPHTVTAQAGGFDSKSIASGESWRYKATHKGTYPYVCTFHPTMKGMLRVK
ncbi:copper-binding protein [Cupriavidus pauculus]|uniref:Copper-binding protein n=2 Tax=Cupriavidus pauculus TaxID=82633 RepID=A0A2N5C225_9BURK|nr:copper-binding protein [Cupriavidus pauculus]